MGKSTFTGPVSGAYIFLPAVPSCNGTATYNLDAALPTGMKMRLVGAMFTCQSATAAAFEVGTTGDVNGYLTSTSFTSVTNGYAAFDGALITGVNASVEVDDADDLLVTVTVTTSLSGGAVWLVGYVTAHATDLNNDGV